MRKSSRRKKKQNKTLIITAAVILLAVVFIVIIANIGEDMPAVDFGVEYSSEDYGDTAIIPNGIYIGTHKVGGLSKAEARSLLEDSYTQPENQMVEVHFEENVIATSLDDLGVSWGIKKAINTAITLGKGGGLVQRYKTSCDLTAVPYHIEVAKTLDRDLVKDFVKDKIASKYDISPINAKIAYEDGDFKITAGQNGRVTSVASTIGAILEGFMNLKEEDVLTVDAVIVDKEPTVTTKALETITDRLGAFTTTYLKPDSERGDRCTNIEVATAYINGTVLMPGESASTSELMKERITENGYATGGMYVDGQLEDAIGGGVCQVATTLYNALLRAEVQIDRRSNHSLLVSYVEPACDAAIATGSKDLVFTNNLETPIFVCGETDGHEVTFTIFGKEYRDSSRSIEFVSIEDKRVKSEEKTTEDWDLYEGEEERVGTAHDEVWAHLDKVVYEDGKEVSRTTLHNDYYMPSEVVIHIGKKKYSDSSSSSNSDSDDDSDSSSNSSSN